MGIKWQRGSSLARSGMSSGRRAKRSYSLPKDVDFDQEKKKLVQNIEVQMSTTSFNFWFDYRIYV